MVINDKEFVLKKMSPNAIATVANILGRLSVDGRKYLVSAAGNKATDSALWGILAVITGDDLVNFASAIIGAPKQFVEENFDLSWVIEAAKEQMKLSGINALLTNFTSASFPTAE